MEGELLVGGGALLVALGLIFAWLKLPQSIDLTRLEALAVEAGVAYTPGRSFHCRSENIKFLRLSYPHMTDDDLRKGVALLSECIEGARP